MRLSLVAAAALLAGCATHHFPASIGEDVLIVPPDGRVEFAVDEKGRVLEVEFHCKVDALPEVVRRTVEAEVPGGRILDCEKEYHGGRLYYEVAKEIGGREVEIMVTPDGRVHSREIEVAESQVPDVVLEAASRAVPESRRTKVEEIRDGAKSLVDYHIKTERRGIRYKVVVSPDGQVRKILRETMAEIEVPVRP